MRLQMRFAFVMWAVFAALLFLPPRVWAGDCSSPSDCQGIPDNGTKAACAGGILAGACTYVRSKQKDEEKTDEGSGEATDMDALFGKPGDGGSSSGPDDAGGGSEGSPTSSPHGGPPDGDLGDPSDLVEN